MEEEQKLIHYALTHLLSSLDNSILEELSEILDMDGDEIETFLEETIENY
jgi:hypothetical protein